MRDEETGEPEIKQYEELVPRAGVQEWVLFDPNDRAPAQESSKQSEARIPRNIDHGALESHEKRMVFLRYREVL